MKFVLMPSLAIAALLSASSLLAEPAPDQPIWQEVRFEKETNTRDFVDPGSLVRDGSLVRLRVRTEFGDDSRGMKWGEAVMEIDCKGKAGRMLSFTMMMTGGEKRTIDKPTSWRDLEPDSPAQRVYDYACPAK